MRASIVRDFFLVLGFRSATFDQGKIGQNSPTSPLSDITLVAEKDFDIREAKKPVFERVTRTIKAGVGPPRIPGEH